MNGSRIAHPLGGTSKPPTASPNSPRPIIESQSPSIFPRISSQHPAPASPRLSSSSVDPSLSRASSIASSSALGLVDDKCSTGKMTVAEIVTQIEMKIARLRSLQNFTKSDTLDELGFLVVQSRYSDDVSVKKKLVTRMVEAGILDIFMKIFISAHAEDCLNIVSKSESSASAEMPDVVSTGSQESLSDTKESLKNVSDALKNLMAALTIMWNLTDKSPLLCEQCESAGVIKLLLKDLTDPRLASVHTKVPHRLFLVKGYMGIMANMVRYLAGSRETLRNEGAVKILQPYLKSNILMVKTKSLMLLSYIISETENDIINASDKNIAFIVKILSSTLENPNHFSKRYGYFAVEIALGLNRLAACEGNKTRIVDKGALLLYVQLTSGAEEEQLAACQGIWSLAFVEENRPRIGETPHLMERLGILERTASRPEVKCSARGALWTIRGRVEEGHPVSSPTPKTGHIMLSYQWDVKPTMLQIRDHLKAAGYKVWMDVERMSGSTLEAMANAIENAAVVVVAMTQKYKDSTSCRTEAEYAYQLKKDVVPLRLQKKYLPDGWLGAMVGTKLYFDFSQGSNSAVFPKFVRELGSRARLKHFGETLPAHVNGIEAPARLAYASSTVSLASTAGIDLASSRVRRWSQENVSQWLTNNQLGQLREKFQNINGELLYELRRMQSTAPESFYRCLKEELQLKFVSVLMLTRALDKL